MLKAKPSIIKYDFRISWITLLLLNIVKIKFINVNCTTTCTRNRYTHNPEKNDILDVFFQISSIFVSYKLEFHAYLLGKIRLFLYSPSSHLDKMENVHVRYNYTNINIFFLNILLLLSI